MNMPLVEMQRHLKMLRLHGMNATLETRLIQANQGASFAEAFACLVQDEMDCRNSRLVETRFKASGLPERPTLTEFDWGFNPKLPKKEIYELVSGKFIRDGADALLIGSGDSRNKLQMLRVWIPPAGILLISVIMSTPTRLTRLQGGHKGHSTVIRCRNGNFYTLFLSGCQPCSGKIKLVDLTVRQGVGNRRGSGRQAGRPCSGKIKLVDLTVRQGVGNRRGSGRQAEAVKDFLDGIGRMNRAEDPHAPAATGASQNVDRKNAPHKLGPGIVPGTAGAFLL
jgi:hypothetical protein